MTYEFRPARRVAETVLLGLVGPSGSGKTLSALLLATGMCAPSGRIVVIDTEGHRGRALQYAPPGENTFDFDHLKLTPPYSATRYQEAFKAAEQRAGEGGVVIIDSMSAEHESEGGALEEHQQRTAGDDRKNMIAWSHIRPKQHALCRALTNSRCHVIVAFRAEDKVKIVGNKPVNIGWQAIGWKRWPYEMQLCVLLSHERKGVPIVDGFDWGKIPINMAGIIPTDRPLTAEVGKRLAAWAAGGDKALDTARPAPDTSANVPERQASKPAASKPANQPAPDTSRATSDRGFAFVVWLSEEEPEARFTKGGDAIEAVIEKMRLAPDFSSLGLLHANNAELTKKAPKHLQDEANAAYRQRFRELNEATATTEHTDIIDQIDAEGLEPEEWRSGEPKQEGLL